MYGWHHYFRELAAIWERYWEGNLPTEKRDLLRREALARWKAINAGTLPFPQKLLDEAAA
jgi:hypothetical protein